ncbi:MAG: hypothetical protein ACREBW_08995, partial [Candidatus Micrarchaeaceae archaeon]
GFEMYALASNLAKHGTYANPFLVLATGPSASNPPLYPLLLALIMKVFRVPALVLLAAAVLNIFANALTAAWLPRVSWLFFGDVGPGIVASVFWLLAFQLMPSWDANLTLAALLFFCLFSSRTVASKNYVYFGVTSGIIAGALFLLNPSSLLIFLPWLAYLSMFGSAPFKQTVVYGCIVLAAAALVVFPWVLRNDRQLGAFVMRTNLGITLYASNNDCASPSLIETEQSGCYETYHPNDSMKQAEALRDMGEVKNDRQRIEDTKAWVTAHPGPFLRLTMARFRDFWFPRMVEHPLKIVVVWIVTILSIPGIALMAYRRERVTAFVLFVLTVYPLMYYVVVSDVRYRYP